MIEEIPSEALQSDELKELNQDKESYACPILFKAIRAKYANPDTDPYVIKIKYGKYEFIKTLEDCESGGDGKGCYFAKICKSYLNKKEEKLRK